MALRQRIILSIILTMIAVTIVFYVGSQAILLTSYTQLEQDFTFDNIERVRNALQDKMTTLTNNVGDWAYWDDTYNYMLGSYDGYIGVNIQSGNYDSLQIDGMIFINTTGEIIFAETYDRDTQTQLTLSDELRQTVETHDSLIFNVDDADPTRAITDILLLDQAPLLIGGRAILTGDKEGPLVGTLLWIRWLDDYLIAEIAEQTKLDVTLHRVDQTLPADVQAIYGNLSQAHPFEVTALNSERIAAYALVYDLENEPTFVLRIEEPRAVYAQGQNTLTYFLLFMGLVALSVVVALWFQLDRLILSPLDRLSQEVKRVAQSRNLEDRVNVEAGAEIQYFAQALNQALVDIEKTQQDLLIAKEAAESANKVKSQFLASMSHELRTPLNAILNFTQFVANGIAGEVNDEQIDLLTKSINSSKHLLNLINDVLDISKIEAGALKLFVEKEVDLEQEALATADIAKSITADKPVEIDLQLQPIPKVLGDRRRLRQVMLNLVSNACKFTEEGKVTIRLEQRDSRVVFSVQDTGPGIAPEDHERIFESFRQSRVGVKQGEGTGLGLTISRRLAQAHGGDLWLESDLGKGATFYVSIPIHAKILEALVVE